MPRTKQVRKTRSIRETTEESDSLVRDFERHAAQQIHKMEADQRMQIGALSNSVEVALSRLPTEIRGMTLGELVAADLSDDNDVDMESAADSPPASPVATVAKNKAKKTKRVTAASDDGYATECTTRGTHVSRINTTRNSNGRAQPRAARSSSSNRNTARQPRATRSTSRTRMSRPTVDRQQHDRLDLLKTTSGPPKTSSKFKTPMLKNQAPCFDTVTPKVKPNTPMNILRRPRDGEMVLSMQGSPLLVSSIVQERMANINVPLDNGNIISLLPNAGLRLSHMPALDHETMQQLKTLKGHIDMVIGSK